MSIEWSIISRILLSHYFSLIMVLCSLLLYLIYRSEEGGKFPVERSIAKWGSVIYFAVGAMSYIVSWFSG